MSKHFTIGTFLVLFVCICLPRSMAQSSEERITDSLIAVLPTLKDDSIKAQLAFRIARRKMGEAQATGSWDDAIRWSKEFLAISKKVNFPFGIRRSHWLIATCWSQKGNYPEAIKYFTKGLQYAYKDSNDLGITAFSNSLAETYLKLGNYQEALKNYFVAYRMVLESDENVQATPERLSLSIANVYAKMEDYPKALEWGRKALPEDPDLFFEGTVPLFLATVQTEMKQFADARQSLRSALQVFPARFKRLQEDEYPGVVGEMYIEYGEAWLRLARLTTGEEQKSAYAEAIRHLNKGVALMSNGSGSKEIQMNGYDLLRQAYESTGEYENALKNLNIYVGIKDSLYNKQTYLKLAKQQMQFERDKAAVEERARLEKIRQTLLADQQLQNERVKLEERLTYQRKIAEDKLQQQTAIAEEKARYDKMIALEKQEQVKLQLEKKRMNNLMVVGSLAVIAIGVLVFLLLRQSAMKKRALEKADVIHKMAELELQSLRSQLNPHFMFNSLNSIQELILMEKNEMSHSYLARFSKLLRILLENAEKSFVPLQKELEFLHLYLGLESLRVPDLQYDVFVAPDVDPGSVMIPNMILQPYIENAIWHGLSHKSNNKKLNIRVTMDYETVKYEIQDNGIGRKKAAELKSFFRREHKSVGMELLNKRFKLLNKEYSSGIRVNISDVINKGEVAGTLVTIEVPTNVSKTAYSHL